MRLALGLALVCGTAFGHSYPVGQATNVFRPANFFAAGSVDVTGVTDPNGAAKERRSGIFQLTYDTTPGNALVGPYQPFRAICIDANETLFSGNKLYYIQTLTSFPTFAGDPVSTTPDLTILNRKANLERLFTVAWADAQTSATKSAAFQWAAWEVGRETAGTFNLNGRAGDVPLDSTGVRITGTGDDIAVKTQANSYLSMINASVQRTQLLIWSPVKFENGQYVRIAGQELLTPVPEPLHYGLLSIAGIVALVYRRRKLVAA